MYPMRTPPIPSFTPGASLLPQRMLQGGMGQLSQFPLQQGAMGQSGGLLSKLLGGAKAGGSGITNIMNMLQGAQKAIGVFQNVGPMVQQYGPLVKSLPALINAMKSSSPNDQADDEEHKKVDEKESTSKKIQKKTSIKTASKKKAPTKKNRSKTQQKIRRKKITKEISKEIPAPKLYI